MAEDFELSDYAKKSLEKARKTPRSQYFSHEDVRAWMRHGKIREFKR